jgi:hypothetical protein
VTYYSHSTGHRHGPASGVEGLGYLDGQKRLSHVAEGDKDGWKEAHHPPGIESAHMLAPPASHIDPLEEVAEDHPKGDGTQKIGYDSRQGQV